MATLASKYKTVLPFAYRGREWSEADSGANVFAEETGGVLKQALGRRETEQGARLQPGAKQVLLERVRKKKEVLSY